MGIGHYGFRVELVSGLCFLIALFKHLPSWNTCEMLDTVLKTLNTHVIKF